MDTELERISRMTLQVNATIRDGLRAIEHGASGVCLLCDDEGVLVGLASDGDLRRALLAGSDLSEGLAVHAQSEPITVRASDRRDQVVDLMNSRQITAVPIVDAAGKLIGVHKLHELLAPEHLENWAVVMAGGRGSRLGSATESVPKPMLQVAGRPILERLILNLVGDGVRKIAISIHYLGHQIEDHFGDGKRFGCEIRWLREQPDLPLGTGGSLSLLAAAGIDSDEPYLVVNADVVTQTDYGHLIREHAKAQAALTVGVAQHRHDVPFGVLVEVDGIVQSVTEKPTFSWPVSSGIYVVSPDLVSAVPSNQDFPITQLIDHALAENLLVRAAKINDDWVDVGNPTDLDAVRDGWEQMNG